MRKKLINSFMILAAFTFFCLLSNQAEAAGYKLIREGTRMRCEVESTGQYITDQFIKHKGYTYYFGKNGYAHTGWLEYGKHYYFFDATGAMVKSRWIGAYFLQKNGRMATSRWVNRTQYVGNDGRLIPGYRRKNRAKFVRTAAGTKYRNYDGTYAKKTWQCINGRWYYFYSTEYMAKSRRIGRYYVDRRGRMLINRSVKIGKYRYYYGSDGRQTRRVRIRK